MHGYGQIPRGGYGAIMKARTPTRAPQTPTASTLKAPTRAPMPPPIPTRAPVTQTVILPPEPEPRTEPWMAPSGYYYPAGGSAAAREAPMTFYTVPGPASAPDVRVVAPLPPRGTTGSLIPLLTAAALLTLLAGAA